MSEKKVWQPRLEHFALAALLTFVFLHSFMPHDPRVRMGFKTFEVEWALTGKAVWIAVKKWRHVLWFLFFFPLVMRLFERDKTRKALVALIAVTILIELQQTVIAGRHARIVDLLPNLIGAGLGAFLAWSLRRWKERRTNSTIQSRVQSQA
jgi:VanZ family protein